MTVAFLIILSFAGAISAFIIREAKTGAGLLLLALASVLQIPNLVTGFWVEIMAAFSIIVYAAGVFVIVWKRKEIKPVELGESSEEPGK